MKPCHVGEQRKPSAHYPANAWCRRTKSEAKLICAWGADAGMRSTAEIEND
jgi:hypothetical protein